MPMHLIIKDAPEGGFVIYAPDGTVRKSISTAEELGIWTEAEAKKAQGRPPNEVTPMPAMIRHAQAQQQAPVPEPTKQRGWIK